MRFPNWLKVYGDRSYRGDCPTEAMEQTALVREIRTRWPHTLGRLALHPRNEGKRDWRTASMHRAEGLTAGASDIIIPGAPTLVLELKRCDHTRCQLPAAEREYLEAAQQAGCRVCVALGHVAALEAIEDWISCVSPLSKETR